MSENIKEKRTRYKVVTLETSLLKGNVSSSKLEKMINDITMTKDGWQLAWLFVDEKRKFIFFSKKTVFLIFFRDVV